MGIPCSCLDWRLNPLGVKAEAHLLTDLLMDPCGKANVLNRGHHLLHLHFACVIGHNRLFRREAHLDAFDTRKPCQGFLDQQRSTRSGHALEVQDDSRLARRCLFRQGDN